MEAEFLRLVTTENEKNKVPEHADDVTLTKAELKEKVWRAS